MPGASFSWMIGGPQGSGINLGAEILAKALSRLGYSVFGNIEYHSNIKGKHSYYRLRVADFSVRSHLDEVHLLAALDEETLLGDLYHEFPAHRGHVERVAAGGGILLEPEMVERVKERLGNREVKLCPIPYSEMVGKALTQAGKGGQAHEYRIMNNTAALGASAGLMGIPFEPVAEVIMSGFGGKARRVGETNVNCARFGYEYAQKEFKGLAFRPTPRPQRASSDKQIMLKGYQAVGMAKLRAGCGVQTYYPISPATDESVYLEEHQNKYNLVVLQTEDEVSAVDAAVMAAHGGVRAATSTSGPGFALMPEGLGFAAMTEAPGPVVCLYQRGGPSTGLPTRHEQGDLRFALHAGQGDIPRMVLAPGDLSECFYDTFDAFNYADRYQLPVILLLDKHLATQYGSLPAFDMSGLRIDRGELFDPAQGNGDYYRYRFTQSGISPRAIPGQEGTIFWTTSDEHDQVGHITEGIGNRLTMMSKRMKKMALVEAEIPETKKLTLVGRDDAPVLVLSWGSTKGAILDALARFDPDHKRTSFLQIRLLHPFPAQRVAWLLKRAAKVLCVESNYSCQLASLVREKTGIEVHHRVHKYDGHPFSEDEIVAGLEAAQQGAGEEILLSEGKVVGPTYGREQVEALVELREKFGRMAPPLVPLPPGYNR
ncbi:MAG: 2-oxoacid:acceptor oxidoreductase subunit alpha [Acidobacteria bacterium]|nr:2-oxoacid:acceptor oxidoreductase subunit alpha [Acidobacteriota bacterium]